MLVKAGSLSISGGHARRAFAMTASFRMMAFFIGGLGLQNPLSR
jgi:hypothetical protein